MLPTQPCGGELLPNAGVETITDSQEFIDKVLRRMPYSTEFIDRLIKDCIQDDKDHKDTAEDLAAYEQYLEDARKYAEEREKRRAEEKPVIIETLPDGSQIESPMVIDKDIP